MKGGDYEVGVVRVIEDTTFNLYLFGTAFNQYHVDCILNKSFHEAD